MKKAYTMKCDTDLEESLPHRRVRDGGKYPGTLHDNQIDSAFLYIIKNGEQMVVT